MRINWRAKNALPLVNCQHNNGISTGEACSHVAALLFKVEAAVKLDLTNPSKTSAACVWNRYYREKVAAEPLSEMNFSQPKHGKVPKRKARTAPDTDSDDDFDDEAALRALKRLCPNACVLTKDDSDTDTASDDEDMPPLLIREHSISGQLTEDALAAECRAFLRDFTVTPTQASNLEKMTRNQSESGLWKRQRLGRITASNAHDVKTRKEGTKSDALMKRIMDSDKTDISGLQSVRFGIVNEKKAKKQYNDIMAKEHDNFVLRDSGLVIDTTFPVFAASPDGVRTCLCHGEGLVEVKCSYKHRDVCVKDIPDIDPSFYLGKENLTLKEGHRHYTQIQFQMFVCQKQFCDFVVYTNKGVFVQTVYYDSTFVKDLIDRCTTYAMSELVPAIIMKKMERGDNE
ncbi:uncharacterized protein LOC127860420 [Dreissena polymorpha]|uniref:uncharacterized protein LOC127860420 n=1 Tax=Dreissena polymorpha TaxID=45954 RepID=UPI0022646373|nr:uncharacterized protein LOC127860420 [Dreissena polymorpha]